MAMTFEDQLTDRTRWHAEPCSVAKVLDLLSTKTAFLVVRECFYGTTRFDDFVARIGTSAPAVSRALKHLEAADVVGRVPYREPGARSRDAYHLTPAGEDLLPIFMALTQWGDRHLQTATPPLAFVNVATGQPVQVRVTSDTSVPVLDSDHIGIQATFTLAPISP